MVAATRRITPRVPLTAGVAKLHQTKNRFQATLEQIEREHLDPLLDRLLTLWGDRRNQQRQTLADRLTVSELTADERQINRGLYITAGSLGLAVAGTLLFPPLRLLSLPGLIYGSVHSYQAAYDALVKERRVNVDVLMALVNTAYIANGMWVLGNLTVTSYFFSLKLLRVIKDRFAQDLQVALARQPQNVWVVAQGGEVQLALAELKVGDVVAVRAGELIPVDGTVSQGEAAVDQQVLTGEARPVEKIAGDPVFAATVVLTGKLYITVAEAGSATTVARIAHILAQTVDFRTTRQLQAQWLTDRLVLPFLGASALTLPFLGFSSAAAVVDAHPYRQLNNLGSLGLLNYLVLATEQGILIKDGRSLEMLHKVDTLVFDKTGTLTQEQPQVTAIHLCAEQSEETVLAYAAAVEQRQSHPLARAILAEAQARQLSLLPVDHATYRLGLGLAVQVAGCLVHVGSARFMTMEAIAIPPGIEQLQETSHRQGHSLVLVALDGRLVGAIELETTLRPEAEAVLTTLRTLAQIDRLILLSGDQPAPTRRLAQAIGADEFYAEVLPAAKAELVATLQKAGRTVCFVGDGINDAIALKQANVSVSLRGATTAATDTAHIVLMEGNLAKLPALFDLAQEFNTSLRHLMLAVLGTSAVGLAGVYGLGWGLAAMTILDQVSLVSGLAVTMRPRLVQRS